MEIGQTLVLQDLKTKKGEGLTKPHPVSCFLLLSITFESSKSPGLTS